MEQNDGIMYTVRAYVNNEPHHLIYVSDSIEESTAAAETLMMKASMESWLQAAVKLGNRIEFLVGAEALDDLVHEVHTWKEAWGE